MMRDIYVMTRKEWREIVAEVGGPGRALFQLGAGLLVAGVLLPYQFGPAYVSAGALIALTALMPVMFILPIVADTFAGERERHTLETLLSTRLPDGAILFGKVASVVSYGWGLATVAIPIGLVTVNLTQRTDGPLLPAPAAVAAAAVAGILTATLLTGGGMFISLRAESVKQAQQRLGLIFLLPFILLPTAISRLSGGWLTNLVLEVQQRPVRAALIAFAALALVDAVILSVAALRFRRARLIA